MLLFFFYYGMMLGAPTLCREIIPFILLERKEGKCFAVGFM